jgi:hypothetical protein
MMTSKSDLRFQFEAPAELFQPSQRSLIPKIVEPEVVEARREYTGPCRGAADLQGLLCGVVGP